MITRFLLIFILYITSSYLKSPVFAEWNKYANNPILTGDKNIWLSDSIGSPSIIIKDGIFQMWFIGFRPDQSNIGYAFSNDGINWEKYPAFVHSGDDNINNQKLHDPRVTFYNGVYTMWYASSDFSIQNLQLNYVQSTDGINWTNRNLNVIPKSLSWENPKGLSFPYMQKYNNLYRLWYGAHGVLNGLNHWRIAYASSSNMNDWNKSLLPILDVDSIWEGHDIGSPNVLFENGIYHMWYHGDREIGHAISSDGINWFKDPNNPVLIRSQKGFDDTRITNPFVLKVNGIYYMYYTGVGSDGRWRIGLASTDNIDIPLPSSFLTPAISPSLAPTASPTPLPTTTSTPTLTPTFTPSPIPTASLTPTVTPTPTPAEFARLPIIIIPGMGASWNSADIFSCNLNSSHDWKLAPFVLTYNSLLSTLTKNARLKLNKDVFLYTYDWRQALPKQADNLNKFIEKVLKLNKDKNQVILVGHSLGGLVIRSYLESYSNDHKVYQVLTAGTPHQGTLVAYPLWENGQLIESDNIAKIVLSQITTACRLKRDFSSARGIIRLKTPKEVLQSNVPSIGSLLPIFDFLIENGGIKKTQSLTYQNDWLATHPFPQSHYNLDFATLSGKGQDTLVNFKVMPPTKEEKDSGNWLDGRPFDSQSTKDGDGTILNISSRLDNLPQYLVSADHGEVVSRAEGISRILDFLHLTNVSTAAEVQTPEIGASKILTISADKDVQITIDTPQRRAYASEQNILVDYSPVLGLYRLSIKSSQNQQIQLHLNLLGKDKISSQTFALFAAYGKTARFLLPLSSFDLTHAQLIRL